uniref:Portal protein n=1 Tax=viral metagenome TaxID=1070528 RepID=A0A6H1ZCS2_9ZZZZ
MDTTKLVLQLRQEYKNGIDYKQGRVKDWQATEDQYFGRVKKTLKGRFNVPMPVMSGFIDTLLSKIDDAPVIKFRPVEEADFRPTKKLQAFYDVVSKSEDNDFDSKDLDGKKLASFYGRALFKTFAESDPKFKFNLHVTDPYDFYVDPLGGGDLENARYCGEDNIFKSKSELIAGANAGLYNSKNVMLLVNGLVENTILDNDNTQQNKANRLSAIGLTSRMHNFMGEGMVRLIESGTVFEGERYYVLWDYNTGLTVRAEPLEKVFESKLWWWTSWATHRDAFNFWSKSPADDIRPVAEVIKILANQELDNRQKRNFGQRAYDPDMFPNGAELEYRPNGLVSVKAGETKTRAIASGIYEFQTPELNGTINLVDWLDGIIGQKSGVTAAAQGSSDDKKVGIYQGNMQQVADRLGLYNKAYAKCHAAIGRRFVWGCYEHLNKAQAVKMIGEGGVTWDEIRKSDINPDVDIFVESSSNELRMSELKNERRQGAIAQILADPEIKKSVNQNWLAEQLLLAGMFDDEDVRVALDTENDGNREVLARASEAIQEIIKGKEPKLFRGATTAYQQKILDFATDNTDDDLELFTKLTDFAKAHDKLVMENMSRKAMQVRNREGLGTPEEAPMPAMPGAIPGMPEPSAPPMPAQPMTPTQI